MIKCKAKNRQLQITVKGDVEEVLLDAAAVTGGIVLRIMKKYGLTRRQVIAGIENVLEKYVDQL